MPSIHWVGENVEKITNLPPLAHQMAHMKLTPPPDLFMDFRLDHLKSPFPLPTRTFGQFLDFRFDYLKSDPYPLPHLTFPRKKSPDISSCFPIFPDFRIYFQTCV